ncbi:hypothetical protein Vadar_022334 [Vaccinium darrowii]|uniref:Uncharacterized protein n=1 Tax=Vaccinium darrowii TaxID=229202 RepID=A0ACB7Y869_9ERIC|nr:hypothetical protein Vadar_022334 [Vaccinium darrowii]
MVELGNEVVGREEIGRVVRLVMEGDEGKVIRHRAKELRDSARIALDSGGSSYDSLARTVKAWKLDHNTTTTAKVKAQLIDDSGIIPATVHDAIVKQHFFANGKPICLSEFPNMKAKAATHSITKEERNTLGKAKNLLQASSEITSVWPPCMTW